jgi:hypothetical protein
MRCVGNAERYGADSFVPGDEPEMDLSGDCPPRTIEEAVGGDDKLAHDLNELDDLFRCQRAHCLLQIRQAPA